MKLLLSAIGGLFLSASLVQAGGIDRTVTGYGLLFDKGRVVTLGFSHVTPDVSGVLDHPLAGPMPTGNMAQGYASLSFSYKADLNDRLSYALLVNTPYGADALYSQGAYTGLEAHWQSHQVAALLKYKLGERASVYGGLRHVSSSATINIPAQMLAPPSAPIALGAYSASTNTDAKLGYVLGAAYEIPDIALRAALTYESAITHEFDTQERFANLAGGATVPGKTKIILPQTVTLDVQSGIAKDTLLFGSVRWSEWSQWHVRPSYYDTVTGKEVTGFNTNVVSYQLGVGRKINDNLSMFVRVGYEQPDGLEVSRLSPTDGRKSIGVGGSWTQDNMKITGGLEYVKLGDGVDPSGTKFSGNTAVGIGFNVAFTF